MKKIYKMAIRCIKNENNEKWEVIIKITETARKKSQDGSQEESAILELQNRLSDIRHLTPYF
ncbi:MAG: hypothetical protein ACXWC7_04860 [Chitinophagaceae bacterium]